MNENFIEYQFSFAPKEPWNEILIAYLGELPFDSFIESENGLNAFILESSENEDDIKNTLSLIEHSISYEKKTVEKVNWNQEWEKNFEPIAIDSRCYIRAEFHEPKSTVDYEIVIQPKMSFGTGHHETTHLIVEYLLDKNLTDLDVLDMGCGTGILGILAKMKQAKSIVGIDIDDWAIENAKENAERNQVDAEFRLGGTEQLKDESFDLILANINKNILLRDIPEYLNVLKSNGTIILSGILHSDFEEMLAYCESLNLKFIQKKQRNEWIALAFTKD